MLHAECHETPRPKPTCVARRFGSLFPRTRSREPSTTERQPAKSSLTRPWRPRIAPNSITDVSCAAISCHGMWFATLREDGAVSQTRIVPTRWLPCLRPHWPSGQSRQMLTVAQTPLSRARRFAARACMPRCASRAAAGTLPPAELQDEGHLTRVGAALPMNQTRAGAGLQVHAVNQDLPRVLSQ